MTIELRHESHGAPSPQPTLRPPGRLKPQPRSFRDKARRLRRAGLSAAIATSMTAGLLVAGAANAGAASVVLAAAATTGSSGSATVGSASYAIPAGALYVSPSGSDTAAGTSTAPLKTVAAAIVKVPAGGTLVLRAGSYHEALTIAKKVTIQNYPGEAAWFDGSSAVSKFVASGTTWRLDGWTAEFDASASYTFGSNAGGFVNAAYPMASHPDQVWIDGVAQQQASSLA